MLLIIMVRIIIILTQMIMIRLMLRPSVCIRAKCARGVIVQGAVGMNWGKGNRRDIKKDYGD